MKEPISRKILSKAGAIALCMLILFISSFLTACANANNNNELKNKDE